MARSDETQEDDDAMKKQPDIPLQVGVEGTVANFTTHTQINPVTGEVFDFNGNKIYSIPEEPPHE